MKSDPRIVDARRRARAAARASGNSYQNTLDEIARSAGRRDWDDFAANPCKVPEQPREGTGDNAVETAMTAIDEASRLETSRHILMRWPGALLALATMTVAFAWTYAYEGPPAESANAILAWERTTAVTSLMQSRYRGNDRTMYVIARRLPNDMRDVRLVNLDNRPADNGFATRLLLRTGLLDGKREDYATVSGDDGLYEVFRRHPVARLRHQVDCRTGMIFSLGIEVADDMTSSPVATISNRPKFPMKLDPRDLETACSADTLERTKRIERVGRPT